MTRILAAVVLFAFAGTASAADFTVKIEDTPPKELAEPVRAVLDTKGLTVLDDKGKALCTVWPRKELASKAGTDRVKAGLSYSDVGEGTLIGAVRFPAEWTDYRKQKIKAGVYTLRLGMQPMDGDHMGTAPYNEFALLCPAAEDKKSDPLDAKETQELSSKSTTRKHPSPMLLFPNPKPADAPAVVSKPQDHWVLNFRTPVAAAGQKAALGFGLVVVGSTTAE